MYAEYLRLFGEIGSKAISSSKDFELYEAIRHLSIIKEDPNTELKEIKEAELEISRIQQNMGEPSEMSKIRNLHWWTVEYGLIGDISKPKIYGAGLLSSIGESESCLKDYVKKIPYSIEAANQPFDITEPQPQLYVTPSYSYLTQVLQQFANGMALRTGGIEGVMKAIESKNTCTSEYSSGIQVSGTFNKLIEKNGELIYLSTSSPTALALQNKELIGHGKDYHKDGFSSPVGLLKGESIPLESMTTEQLSSLGIESSNWIDIEFESGVKVSGKLINIDKNIKGENMLMSFEECTVTYNEEALFLPDWGMYDMAVGQKITSVFSGAADIPVFSKDNSFVPSEKTHKIIYSNKRKELHKLYQKVRDVRKGDLPNETIYSIWADLINYEQDWLCAIELLEICEDNILSSEIIEFLKKKNEKSIKHLVEEGLSLVV